MSVQTLQQPDGFWRLLRPWLFRLDPEQAHRLVLNLGAAWGRLFSGQLTASHPARNPAWQVQTMGLSFPNPFGLAAGLDKDAVAIPLWQHLGFGFVEVGTVTAHAQPGNQPPRLFRLPADEALVNRMGFNNSGAQAVAHRLATIRSQNCLQIPLGVNLGKSKCVDLAQAASDYQQSFQWVAEFADYIVINISSPNTPELRNLQAVADIAKILTALQQANQQLSTPRPLLVKLAPDLNDEQAIACAHAVLDYGGCGLVLTNTTVQIETLQLNSQTDQLTGGLSGAPLFDRSTQLLKIVRQALGPDPILIGVGGILNPAAAAAKFAAGANLVQIYTGLIYHGPYFIQQLLTQVMHEPSAD
jgi:dihydroorotate dehydrogenase